MPAGLDYFRDLVTSRLEAGVVDAATYVQSWRDSLARYARYGNREFARACEAELERIADRYL